MEYCRFLCIIVYLCRCDFIAKCFQTFLLFSHKQHTTSIFIQNQVQFSTSIHNNRYQINRQNISLWTTACVTFRLSFTSTRLWKLSRIFTTGSSNLWPPIFQGLMYQPQSTDPTHQDFSQVNTANIPNRTKVCPVYNQSDEVAILHSSLFTLPYNLTSTADWLQQQHLTSNNKNNNLRWFHHCLTM